MTENEENELTVKEQEFFASKGTVQPEAAPVEPSQPPDPSAAAPSGEPATPPAPEPRAEPEKDTRKVPLPALQEERRKNADLSRQLEETNQRMELLDRRLAAMFAANEAAHQPQAPAIPDPEQAPIEAVKYALNQINGLQQERARTWEEQQRAEHIRRQQAYVAQNWGRTAREFVQYEPSFPEAYRYVVAQRMQEHIAGGLTHEQAAAATRNDEFNLVANAMQERVNPAERMMAIARARGWNPAPPQRQEQPAQTLQPAAVDRLSTIAAGQEANKSLSTAGTGAAARSGPPDARRLAEMTDEEFDVFLSKGGPKAFKQALAR